jgi:hypothetical protein
MIAMAVLTEVASNLGHCGAIFISLKDRIKYRRFIREMWRGSFFVASSIADRSTFFVRRTLRAKAKSNSNRPSQPNIDDIMVLITGQNRRVM